MNGETTMIPGEPPARSPKVLIFIVAYFAETTLRKVLARIPDELLKYEIEVLVIDDASKDRTFQTGEEIRLDGSLRFKLTVLANPANLGYGGNQKLGYRYAIEHGFDIVALVHGDGQYAPEVLPELLLPILNGEADTVFGSRMLKRFAALEGGMPLYKYVGNKILSRYENWILGTDLSEFHSGYRLYSVSSLKRIPFELNTNVFHFDTEIIVQFVFAGLRIKEVPIPTYYGDEICRVNGMRYAWDCVRSVTAAFFQKYQLVYRRNFDVQIASPPSNERYLPKLGYDSSHTRAIAEVTAGERVIDLGCGPGVLAPALRNLKCHLTGVDCFPPASDRAALFDEFIVHDLNSDLAPLPLDQARTILLLDVIEHMHSPETFCHQLRLGLQKNLPARVIISTPNIGFWVVRFMLLLGQFNYGQRGILDLTHTRLFTRSSIRRFMQETGFDVEKISGIPPPIPMALGSGLLGRTLMGLHGLLTRLLPGLFAYQIFLVARPRPTVTTLLANTHEHSVARRNLGAPV